MTKARVFALVAVLTGLLAACGGGGSSSVETTSGSPPESAEIIKDQFIQEADTICSDTKAHTASLEQGVKGVAPRGERPEMVSALLRRTIPIIEEEAHRLRELTPPGGDRNVMDKMIQYVEDGPPEISDLAEAFEAGDASKVGQIGRELTDASRKATAIAKGFGLKVCGSEEGPRLQVIR